jgi:DNA modification methylase
MFKYYNEDCFNFLQTINDKSIDLILIDPPYEISRPTNF